MRCAFSVPPLAALLAAGLPIVGVVLPGPAGGPPVRAARTRWIPLTPLAADGTPSGRSIDHLAAAHAIPLLTIGDPARPDVLGAIAGLAPDLIVAACFPRRLPDVLLAIPTHGSLNLHPSLLPRWRGPDPLFWTFHGGDALAGVTIHRMTSTFDTGPILWQRAIGVAAGVRAHELEEALAEIGAAALAEVVRDVWGGADSPRDQDGSLATHAPLPRAEDWLVSTERDATWAFNFVRGVAELGGPLAVDIARSGRRIRIADALSMEPDATSSRPISRDGDAISVQFSTGTCRFLLAEDPGEL